MILVMIDSYSRKIWTNMMGQDSTSLKTLAILYGWFCEEVGFPTVLVSDNGPQLVSKEFEDKMVKWGIKHLLTPPSDRPSQGEIKENGLLSQPHSITRWSKIHLQSAWAAHRTTGRCPFELVRDGPTTSLFPRLTPNSSSSERTGMQSSAGRLSKKSTFAEDE